MEGVPRSTTAFCVAKPEFAGHRAHLGVNPQQILNWTNGIEPVPAQIFLKIVDVVVAATPEEIQRSRQVLTNGNLFPASK